jgi:hypothetical protein
MTTTDTAKPTELTLAKGGHESPEQGLCYMEWIAYATGQPHSDRPPCVSPVLGAFGRHLNDVLPDDLRQQLKVNPGLEPVGTAGDGHDEQRGYMALDWLIRTWLPAWLELSPACRDDAVKVRELGRIVDLASAERAGPVVRQARTSAAAAGAAAGAAARAAAWAAAGAAERQWQAQRLRQIIAEIET